MSIPDEAGNSLKVFRLLKYLGPLTLILVAFLIGEFGGLDPETLKLVQLSLLGVAVVEFFAFGWMASRYDNGH